MQCKSCCRCRQQLRRTVWCDVGAWFGCVPRTVPSVIRPRKWSSADGPCCKRRIAPRFWDAHCRHSSNGVCESVCNVPRSSLPRSMRAISKSALGSSSSNYSSKKKQIWIDMLSVSWTMITMMAIHHPIAPGTIQRQPRHRLYQARTLLPISTAVNMLVVLSISMVNINSNTNLMMRPISLQHIEACQWHLIIIPSSQILRTTLP
mmetsp:Transcript_10569/g.30202  ORF Transcript_10569/g.30202 Transcript_10569/m.30202 type:complete len:205 (-) Transcript_10569:572-1186(-)